MALDNEQMLILKSLEFRASHEFTHRWKNLPSAGRGGAPEEEGRVSAQDCWIDGFEVRVSRHSGDHGSESRVTVASSSVLRLSSFSPLLPPSRSRFFSHSSCQYPARMVSNSITRQEHNTTPCCSPGAAPSRGEHEPARDGTTRARRERARQRRTGYGDQRRVAASARLARRRGT